MMESFLEDAENSLHHRTNNPQNSYGHGSSGDESDEDPMDDPFLYDKFLQDPDWAKVKKKEEEAPPKVLVDPGPFRYNQRVFVTSLPAMMLVLALGGETLVLMAAIGTTAVAVMSQLSDSRRCVITFVIIFIPSHMYVMASVLPLLWLSMWHFFLLLMVNVFVVLSACWVMLQFKAFRMEEPNMCDTAEVLLFTLYPLVSTALTCWGLGAVLPVLVLPITFSLIWFVLLQLYLVPTLSSFRTQATPEENLDVVQLPIVTATVLVFVFLGPFLFVFLSVITPSAPFSLISVVHFIFLLSLTLFLSTLLSIRQIFEYTGLPYTTAVYVRWGSGIVCTAICYPVLEAYGFDSHFLPLLPVAIAIFATLGVVLAFKRRRVIMAGLACVLVTSLIALFVLWIQRMPHNLQHYFMGFFPINGFYLLMCVHFLLCLLCLWTSSMDSTDLFGTLLVLQAMALAACEVSLHNSGLYSTTLLMLSGTTAIYAVHRLHIGGKAGRGVATLATTVHASKTVASAIAALMLDAGGTGQVTLYSILALGAISYAVVSVFVYNSINNTGTSEMAIGKVVQDIFMLLGALALNSHHLLLPVAMVMFQGSQSYTNVIGLWCMLGGGLILLYSQAVVDTNPQSNANDDKETKTKTRSQQVLKFALGLASMGVIVMLVHPRLALTFMSLFQWLEILSLYMLVVVTSAQPKLSPTITVFSLFALAVCPGIRATLWLWNQLLIPNTVLCVAISAALLVLAFISIFITEMTETSDKVMKYSLATALLSCHGLLGLDLANYLSMPINTASLVTFWTLPAWKAMLVTGLVLAVLLKLVHATKGPDKLPTLSETGLGFQIMSLPLLTNVITVLTFALACSQGPADPTLHDLWCCASSTVLACLQRDSLFLPKLKTGGEQQAAPTIAVSGMVLSLATAARSRLWSGRGFWAVSGGFFEVVLVFVMAPIFYSTFRMLWKAEVFSEPAVVFLTPYSVLLVLLASSYTAWVLAVAALVAGVWMMLYRLPMAPYGIES